VPADLDVRGLVCPHVKELVATAKPPFQAFPNLVYVSFSVLTHKALQDLTRWFSALQNLMLTTRWKAGDVWIVRAGASEVETASVYRSIAQMQHLTHLEVSFRSGTELLAFTLAAATVRTPKLRRLHVHGRLTLLSLVQLQHIRGLDELTLHLDHDMMALNPDLAEALNLLLMGLAMIPKVCLVLQETGDPQEMQQEMVEAARQQAACLGLPKPAVVQVSVEQEGKWTRW
jgi:hypothetical protein